MDYNKKSVYKQSMRCKKANREFRSKFNEELDDLWKSPARMLEEDDRRARRSATGQFENSN